MKRNPAGFRHHQAGDPALGPLSGLVALRILLPGKGKRTTIAPSHRVSGECRFIFRRTLREIAPWLHDQK